MKVAVSVLALMFSSAAFASDDVSSTEPVRIPASEYGPLQKDGTRQGPANCQHPIVSGGSHSCPAGEHPRFVGNAPDFTAAFTASGGGGNGGD